MEKLDRGIARRAKQDKVARRLMTISGIGAVTATALAALAPPAETFRRGRDFAAWLGLTPLQRSSGGKEGPGRTSRMGERTLRRLLMGSFRRQPLEVGAVCGNSAKYGSVRGALSDERPYREQSVEQPSHEFLVQQSSLTMRMWSPR